MEFAQAKAWESDEDTDRPVRLSSVENRRALFVAATKMGAARCGGRSRTLDKNWALGLVEAFQVADDLRGCRLY